MTTKLVTAKPDETTDVVLKRMADANVGAILICDGPGLEGIFTERDVLRLAAEGGDFRQRAIGEVMTARPVTASADDDILAVADLMRERKVRHVPVVEGDNVHGIVSVRDLLAFLIERLWSEHDPSARETARTLLQR